MTLTLFYTSDLPPTPFYDGKALIDNAQMQYFFLKNSLNIPYLLPKFYANLFAVLIDPFNKFRGLSFLWNIHEVKYLVVVEY